jgi:hypothetical protein
VEPIQPGSADAKAIDAALLLWRQGDLALDARWFVHAADPTKPLTAAAVLAPDTELQAVMTEVEGLVIVTQTCDIVRHCVDRKFIELSPLVETDAQRLREIERLWRPGYAYIPATAPRRLVADLDRVMTVEKSVLASMTRTPGWSSDGEGRAFARALARKRVRYAFPDDFTEFVQKLAKRISEKHEKNSPEGRALRSLREIRVTAAPSWNAEAVELMFWFLRAELETTFEGHDWSAPLEKWLQLVLKSGRYVRVEGQVTTLDLMTASDYLESDQLDLDHLSARPT